MSVNRLQSAIVITVFLGFAFHRSVFGGQKPLYNTSVDPNNRKVDSKIESYNLDAKDTFKAVNE